jgi:hypothetical protein
MESIIMMIISFFRVGFLFERSLEKVVTGCAQEISQSARSQIISQGQGGTFVLHFNSFKNSAREILNALLKCQFMAST